MQRNDIVIKTYKEGFAIKSIAWANDISIQTVYQILRKNNIKRDRPHGMHKTEIVKAAVKEYYKTREFKSEICRKYNITYVTLMNGIRKFGK